MKEVPGYLRFRHERRQEALEKFLREMVLPEDFTSDDISAVEKHCFDSNPESAFCEWFELGDWFYSEMESLDFNVLEFLFGLRSDIEQEEREANEEYHVQQSEYRHMVKGGEL